MSANAPVAAQPDPNQKKPKNKMLIGCVIAGGVVLCLIVPITGILAAIAIPNFIRYQCKSKQSEAKSTLKSLYYAEQSFYAEHNFYSSDLKSINFQTNGTTHYLYGFAEAGPGNLRKSEEPADYDESRQTSGTVSDKRGSPLTVEDLPGETLVDRDHFVAGAVGDIGSSSGLLDTWTIDEKGTPKNTFSGCGERSFE